jgi:uncharacterized membrane protein
MKSRRRDRTINEPVRTTTAEAPPRAPSALGRAPVYVGKRSSTAGIALEENVQAIRAWEQTILLRRSRAEQIGDWIACTAASGPVLLGHLVWFTLWVTANVGVLPGIAPFDPFPFPFLTMTVSLEAIFLALFVLASQNRLARQADKRAISICRSTCWRSAR